MVTIELESQAIMEWVTYLNGAMQRFLLSVRGSALSDSRE